MPLTETTVAGAKMTGFTYWVYFLARKPYGTLYIGVINDRLGRVQADRNATRENPRWTNLYSALRALPGTRVAETSGGMGPRDKRENDKR